MGNKHHPPNEMQSDITKGKHLYKFNCFNALWDLGFQTGAEDLCVNCNEAIFFIVSTPFDYLRDICKRIIQEDIYCVMMNMHDFEDSSIWDLPIIQRYNYLLQDSELCSTIDECITDLGTINDEEIKILKKFGIDSTVPTITIIKE